MMTDQERIAALEATVATLSSQLATIGSHLLATNANLLSLQIQAHALGNRIDPPVTDQERSAKIEARAAALVAEAQRLSFIAARFFGVPSK